MRRRDWVTAGVAVALVFGGWQVLPWLPAVFDHDEWKDRGTPVTATVADLTRPDRDQPEPWAGFDQHARYRAESLVLAAAGVRKPTTSTCTADGDEWVRCVVGYDGLQVVIRLGRLNPTELQMAASMPSLWRVRAESIVVTRAGVLALIWQRYSGYRDLRCEDFPEQALVRTGPPLPQHCYGYPPGRKIVRISVNPGSNGELDADNLGIGGHD